MANVQQHYDQVLSDVYSWMHGGFDAGIARNAEFFARHRFAPSGSGLAVDLGAGCGFQSIVLARLGYHVVALDLDRKLLTELEEHAHGSSIETVQDDLCNFRKYAPAGVELAVCMVDTLLHLDSRERVRALFDSVAAALEPGGAFVLTFRDLSRELRELDRFIPVRSDERIVFTCFLEHESETVKVHDLVYRREAGEWHFRKSFYRKLRLAPDWVAERLRAAGFDSVHTESSAGLVTVIAARGALDPHFRGQHHR